MVKLGEVASYINGYAFKPEDRGSEGLPIIRIQDLTGNSYDLGYYSGNYPKKIEINDGDILISWSASLGVYTWNKGKALLNQHIFKVEFIEDSIDKKYFVYAVRKKIDEMIRKSHGATMKHIVKKDFEDTLIPYPNLEVQSKIAGELDGISKIIYMRKQQLKLYDNLVRARFFELFVNTDYRYEKEPLNNNIKEMFIGPFGSAVKNEVFVDKEKAFCMVYEQKHAIQKTLDLPTRYIDRKKFDELKRFTVMGGDIIVSCRGTIGEIYSVPDDAPIGIMHPSIMKIRLKPEKYCNLFFVVMLNQFMKENVEKSNGSGIKMAITAKDLGKELFVVPPIKEQMKFEKFVNQIDKSKLLAASQPQIHIYKTLTLL